MANSVEIIKSNGEREAFDSSKLKDSLLRASTSLLVAQDITNEITETVEEGMTTAEIYKSAFAQLNKKEKIPMKN